MTILGGTDEYMAPEQLTQEKSIKILTDVYQFGCLVAELFFGINEK